MHLNEVFAKDLVHFEHRFWPKLESKNKANTQQSYLESQKYKLASDLSILASRDNIFDKIFGFFRHWGTDLATLNKFAT